MVTLSGSYFDQDIGDNHFFLWHVDSSNGQVVPDGTQQTFQFIPTDNGTYTLTFTVTDSTGETGTDVTVVTVTNALPTATLTNNGP